MRTIETLGSKKKLITTNTEIENYDFYIPNNICIINRDNPEISESLLRSVYEDLDGELYFKYSLSGWISFVFC